MCGADGYCDCNQQELAEREFGSIDNAARAGCQTGPRLNAMSNKLKLLAGALKELDICLIAGELEDIAASLEASHCDCSDPGCPSWENGYEAGKEPARV